MMKTRLLIIPLSLFLCVPSCQTEQKAIPAEFRDSQGNPMPALLVGDAESGWCRRLNPTALPVKTERLQDKKYREECRDYVRYMIKRGDLRDVNGFPNPSLLLLSVVGGDEEQVRYLVNHGFDVNVEERTWDFINDPCPKRTALHVAVQSNQPEMVALLLSLGANPKLKACGPLYPFSWKKYTAIEMAENMGHHECWYVLRYNVHNLKEFPCPPFAILSADLHPGHDD